MPWESSFGLVALAFMVHPGPTLGVYPLRRRRYTQVLPTPSSRHNCGIESGCTPPLRFSSCGRAVASQEEMPSSNSTRALWSCSRAWWWVGVLLRLVDGALVIHIFMGSYLPCAYLLHDIR